MTKPNLIACAKRLLNRGKLSTTGVSISHETLSIQNSKNKEKMSAEVRSGWEEAALTLQQGVPALISPEKGFISFRSSDESNLESALDLVSTKCSIEWIQKNVTKESKKNTFLSFRLDLKDPTFDKIRRLVIEPQIIGPVARYLNAAPVLRSVMVWVSPSGGHSQLVGSQLFHCDREDRRQIKCFLPIEETGIASGPLTVLPAAITEMFFDHHRSRGSRLSLKQRFSDDAVYDVVGRGHEVRLLGDRGTIVFVDTTSCLHFGSRNVKSPRYQLVLQYLSPYCDKLWPVTSAISDEALERRILCMYES